MMEIAPNFLTDIIDEDIENGLKERIHTRFPPEPNGYLHIGSAKAIFINYFIAKKYNGLFNLRYDDTNPVKEDTEFVESIARRICAGSAQIRTRSFTAPITLTSAMNMRSSSSATARPMSAI